nr:DUF305 domain-containing protein [Beutenbergia cavernae]
MLLPAIVLATAVSVAACSNGEEPSHDMSDMSSAPASSGETAGQEQDVNDADVVFAQMMIPHHAQAIEMADLILGKADIRPEVTDLALEIKEAQGPEISQLAQWLGEWGAEETAPEEMDHGPMDGMMSEEDMQALESAQGAEAERLFLEQMIVHHEGAIEMAETQLEDGLHEPVHRMAQDIVDTQQAEISTMEQLLATT